MEFQNSYTQAVVGEIGFKLRGSWTRKAPQKSWYAHKANTHTHRAEWQYAHHRSRRHRCLGLAALSSPLWVCSWPRDTYSYVLAKSRSFGCCYLRSMNGELSCDFCSRLLPTLPSNGWHNFIAGRRTDFVVICGSGEVQTRNKVSLLVCIRDLTYADRPPSQQHQDPAGSRCWTEADREALAYNIYWLHTPQQAHSNTVTHTLGAPRRRWKSSWC